MTHKIEHPYDARKVEFHMRLLVGAALIVFVLLCALLVRDFRHISRLDYVSSRETSWINAIHDGGTATGSDVGVIQPWMTFDYVNHLFGLPPQYLQVLLSITDSRYPHLTVIQFSADEKTSRAAALTEVQNSVQAFFAQK